MRTGSGRGETASPITSAMPSTKSRNRSFIRSMKGLVSVCFFAIRAFFEYGQRMQRVNRSFWYASAHMEHRTMRGGERFTFI